MNHGSRFCDGRSRRSFLRVGALSFGSLTLGLPEVLRGSEARHKSVILVYLSGGLSHLETFDLKPDAPAEMRGEVTGIDTVVPGLRFGEHLPRLASVADKLAVVRSLVGQVDEHSSFQTMTGMPMGLAEREGRPHFGSLVSNVSGPVDPVVPPFVDLFPTMQHRPYNSPGPGRLGSAYRAARLSGEDVELMRPEGLGAGRVHRRQTLLSQFDSWRREMDTLPVSGMETTMERAFDVLSSRKVADALDLEKEDPRIRDRYGYGSPTHMGDGAPLWNDQLLAARRLVEAGARVVTVAYGFWDTHSNNFEHLRLNLPTFDRGLAALVEDLHMRGLDRDVSVVVWGEFSRTPKINKDAGRDHWAPVNFALFAGGGMKTGQAIGSTDRTGAQAVSMPIPYVDVLATIYQNLGIDSSTMVEDRTGRPSFVLPATARPIKALQGLG